jgi:hypothetical protein
MSIWLRRREFIPWRVPAERNRAEARQQKLTRLRSRPHVFRQSGSWHGSPEIGIGAAMDVFEFRNQFVSEYERFNPCAGRLVSHR